MTRRFEKGARYLEITLDGCRTRTAWGLIGGAGKASTSTWGSESEARAKAAQKVRAKLSEGYVEVSLPATIAPVVPQRSVLDVLHAERSGGTGKPIYTFEPVPGIAHAWVSRTFGFDHYLVTSGDLLRALAMNVKRGTSSDALVLGVLRAVSEQLETLLAVESARPVVLPEPIGTFDALLVFSAEAAQPKRAYPEIAKRVGWVVPGYRRELRGDESIAEADARRSIISGVDHTRAPVPVLDARYVADGAKSKGGGSRFLVWERRVLVGVVERQLARAANGWLEVRNWRNDILRFEWSGGPATVKRAGRPDTSLDASAWTSAIDAFIAER